MDRIYISQQLLSLTTHNHHHESIYYNHVIQPLSEAIIEGNINHYHLVFLLLVVDITSHKLS